MTLTITDPGWSQFLTVAQAAEELRVTERFIRKLIATGDLEAVKVGNRLVRIRRASLEQMLRPVLVVSPPPRRR
ncbi:MAG: helix-turn-helix domain-containing protein [Cellulomonas sp.]